MSAAAAAAAGGAGSGAAAARGAAARADALNEGPLADNGCQFSNPLFAPAKHGWDVVDAYSNAVIEEKARCDPAMRVRLPLLAAELKERGVEVTEFEER